MEFVYEVLYEMLDVRRDKGRDTLIFLKFQNLFFCKKF
jgi:hypothetical protein